MATASANIKSNVKNINSKASASEIESRISRLKSEISGLTEAVADYGTKKAGALSADAEVAYQDLTEQSREALESAKAEIARIEKELYAQVRRNPLQAIGIAAGVGFLAALLMRR